MKKILKPIMAAVMLSASLTSCNKYLDIVPDDGVATLEMAFNMRSQAFKYLASCYSFLASTTPGAMDYVGFTGGDEVYTPKSQLGSTIWAPSCAQISLGMQNVTTTYDNNFASLYQAFRYCNTLVDNIYSVPDMEHWEQEQWAAEAKVLKAFYLFNAVSKWGPVPIVRENKEINAGIDEARVFRDNIDDCFDYMIQLIDEALPALYLKEASSDELGRVTKPAAAMLKARIAVTAASPLFNNNADQALLVDKRGERLFPEKTPEQEAKRWEDAVQYCKEAIDICHDASKELYTYQGSFRGDARITQELTLREMICDSWNSEFIWGNTRLYSANKMFQRILCPNPSADLYPAFYGLFGHSFCGAPLKVANQFYTVHGVPVENDPERSGISPTDARTARGDEIWYIQDGYPTAEFNFDREPRFYAFLGFDGGYWLNSDQNNIQPSQLSKLRREYLNCNCITGYMMKKLVKYDAGVTGGGGSYKVTEYVYPMMRLADLYLLYAEAINESEGPEGPHSAEMFEYLDKIRERAGIPGVKEAWDKYSDSPGRYRTKVGMRDIIHRERNIELCFEGSRYWDLRRWKEAPAEYAKNIYAWDWANYGSRSKYYNQILILEQQFSQRDYFYPFSTTILENNPNLVQNLGW